MDLTILWILFAAWAATSTFYLLKIKRIAHSNKLSIFSPLSKYNRTLRGIVRGLFIRIILLTIVLLISVLLVFFVRSSSTVG